MRQEVQTAMPRKLKQKDIRKCSRLNNAWYHLTCSSIFTPDMWRADVISASLANVGM